jgi:hypothetical protein
MMMTMAAAAAAAEGMVRAVCDAVRRRRVDGVASDGNTWTGYGVFVKDHGAH